MDTSELHTDGNAIAGLLQQVFAGEVTTARHVCEGCGADHAVGEHMAYHGAGEVLRCPNCGQVAATVVEMPSNYAVSMSGMWRMSTPQ